MGARTEVSWKTRSPEGGRREVYARRVGTRWRFFVRERRFENWMPLISPPLEDWLFLLDGVRRRVGRRLLRPEDEARLVLEIRERFPEAEFK